MTAPDTRRLFFALWPDETVRAGIVARRDALGPVFRRRVPDHNLHATLLFLGDQPAGRVDAIAAATDEIEAGAFTLRLDRFGHFARARVLWLGGDAPAGGVALAEALAARMGALDLEFDHRPWTPHVTLFRQVARRQVLPAPAPLDWAVDRFCLVESVPGRPYQVLRRRALDWAVGIPPGGA